MESFVGWTFFLLLIVGCGLLIVGSRGPKIAKHCSPIQIVGFLIEGAAFLWFALMTSYFVAVSPRPTIVGTITALHQSSGKYPSSDFTVLNDSEGSAKVRCEYNGTRLKMGERIRVRYIAYNRQLLEAELLNGPVADSHIVESDGMWSEIFLGIFGLVFLFIAYRGFRRLPLP